MFVRECGDINIFRDSNDRRQKMLLVREAEVVIEVLMNDIECVTERVGSHTDSGRKPKRTTLCQFTGELDPVSFEQRLLSNGWPSHADSVASSGVLRRFVDDSPTSA